MKGTRIFLIVWGLICLITPVLSALEYPLMKLTTPKAITSIENSFINTEQITKEEKKSYEFLRSWILGNDKALIKSAKFRQKTTIFLGVFSAIFCFLGAIYFPRLARTKEHPHRPINTGKT